MIVRMLHLKIRKTVCTAMLALVASYCSNATADVTADWQSTENALSRQVLERSNVISDFTKLVDDHFINSEEHQLEDLKVTVSDGPHINPGPHINTEATELVLPYGYFSYAIKSHAELEETREAALERAIDTVEYTLYHLFGHLIASDNSSDADELAEALSSWLMIKGFTNGGEQWFKDAEAFGRASQILDGPLEDYWHEHSLYKSRQKTLNCWILGSAPERYASLLKPVLEPQQRIQHCIEEWNNLDAEMQTLLQDNIRSDSKLIAE